MPTRQIAELETTLATFRSVLANHQKARTRLNERRAKIEGELTRELDRLLAINEQTSATLARTIRNLEQQMTALRVVAARPRKAGIRPSRSEKGRRPAG